MLTWHRKWGSAVLTLGVVEGLNGNAKLSNRKVRGFRTYQALETAR
jgi:transposase